jgi:WD40 repeat protein
MTPIKTKLMIGFIVILIGSCGLSPFSQNNIIASTPSLETTALNPQESNPTSEVASSDVGDSDLPPVITASNVINLKETARTTIKNPSRMVWFLDSSKAAVLSQDNLTILNTTTLLSEGSIEFMPPIFSLAFSPYGPTVASTSDQITLDLREVVHGSVIRTISPPGQILAFDFSPDGKYLLTGSVDEIAVSIWDVTSGQEVKKLSGFETAAPVYNVVFAPDNRSIIWISRAAIQLMDIATGKLGNRFEHEDFISAFAVSKDGKWLATAAGGTINGEFVPLIRIWDISNGQQVGLIQVDKMPFGDALAFSPDSQLLAAGMGPTVLLWSVPLGEQLAEFQVGGEGVSSISFSPDGGAIGSTSTDGPVTIWRVSP